MWGVLLQREGIGVGAAAGAIGGGRRTTPSVEHHCWGEVTAYVLHCPPHFPTNLSQSFPSVISPTTQTRSYQMKKGVTNEESPEAKFSVALSAQSPLQLTLTSSALQLLKQLAQVWTIKNLSWSWPSCFRAAYYTHYALHVLCNTIYIVHVYMYVCMLPFLHCIQPCWHSSWSLRTTLGNMVKKWKAVLKCRLLQEPQLLWSIRYVYVYACTILSTH